MNDLVDLYHPIQLNHILDYFGNIRIIYYDSTYSLHDQIKQLYMPCCKLEVDATPYSAQIIHYDMIYFA